jgi:hypothetical protein
MQELPRDHPLRGREFDWLGIDCHGHVAAFSNAGYGPLPETVTEHLADVDAALERADDLPAIGAAGNIENPEDGDYSFWYSYSAKGLYAYDWARLGRPVPASFVTHGPDQHRPPSGSTASRRPPRRVPRGLRRPTRDHGCGAATWVSLGWT